MQRSGATQVIQDSGREIPFDPVDLIYSRTDERGVIKGANAAFRKLSGYDWEELDGAPHRILRHSDMPKGFYHLFWSLLKAGQPAIGYVKNRTKDGRFYWVLACAIPCEGGYFSLRLKSTSPFHHQVRQEYATLLQHEQSEGLQPEESAARLIARLKEIGFESYDHFMAHAMTEEVRSRNTLLARVDNKEGEQLTKLVELIEEAMDDQVHLVSGFSDLMLLPLNMRLVAAQLEPQGGPISQISMNYKTASDEIAGRLSRFVSGDGNLCARMVQSVRQGLVLQRCAALQSELVSAYDRDATRQDASDAGAEKEALLAAEADCIKSAQTIISEAARSAGNLAEAAADVRRMILGLDTIRILGRVESRRDPLSEASMSDTIDQIDKVQGEITARLKNLTDLTARIQMTLSSLKRPAQRAPASIAAR